MSDYLKMLVHNRLTDWRLDGDKGEMQLSDEAIDYLMELIEWATLKTVEEQREEWK